MSAKDFLKKRCGVMIPMMMMMMMMMMMIRYEIVVMLEGVVEQTGNSIQVNIAGSDASTWVFRGKFCLCSRLSSRKNNKNIIYP